MTTIKTSYINNPQPSPRIKSDNAAGGQVSPSAYTNVGPQPRNPEARPTLPNSK